MAKKESPLGIPETKGLFQVKGILTGAEKDKFYKETKTKTDKPFRSVNFGVKTDDKATTYINLTGMEQEKVYFSKTETVDGKKHTDVQDVAWKDRFKYAKEGYKLIGVNTGLSKVKDEKGNDVNDKKTLTAYDACKAIGENLKDGQSIFVKGNIEYSHFEANDKTVKNSTKFIPSQISLAKTVDFSEEGYVPQSDFTQTIVFIDIKPREDTKFVVSTKIVGYNTVEDAEFIIVSKDLAMMFKKGLKPYHSIKVWGKITSVEETTEVESQDVWGEDNSMDKIDNPIIRELIITGADPQTIDKTTYGEKILDEAMTKIKQNKKAEQDFGNGDTWGNQLNKTTNDDSESPWD
jgi:hypothetical protein